MIQKFRTILRDHKYKVGVFGLLAAASAICVALVAARIAYTGARGYTNLVWNLFLAWIPFVLAYIAYILSWRKPMTYIVIPVFAFLWLIFFPNAPYILTDLQHLGRYSGDVPLWYDVILLVWFSWTGMLLGIVSLNLMQEIVKRELGRLAGWVFVLLAAGLTSVGLYLGRFIRLNSWDILRNPLRIASNVTDWLEDPSLRSLGFIALYTLFFIFVYLTLYAFGHILREGPRGSTRASN
jgi:uncharacterized membrane protein